MRRQLNQPKPIWPAVLAALLCALGLWAFMPAAGPTPTPTPTPAPQASIDAGGNALELNNAAAGAPAARHFGYVPNRQGTERFIRSLPAPFMAQAAPMVLAARDETPVLLYRALYEAYAAHNNGAKWRCSKQEIGDCVSHGWGQGHDHLLAVAWKLGESSEWRSAATEAIYGGSRCEARGQTYAGFGDGSYGAAAAKWVRDWGIVYREAYPGVDLSQYSGSRAKQWGAYGCGGKDDGGKLDQVAKLHPITNVVCVTTFNEAAAAIQSGYPVAVCSGQGFSERRDAQGFSAPSGSWAHCMVFVGARFDRPGLLCLNSWGTNWVSGAKWPNDQPDGSFWVDARVCDRMLAGRDSFAMSGARGFPFRNLKNGDWVQVDPSHVDRIERRIAAKYRPDAVAHSYSLAP